MGGTADYTVIRPFVDEALFLFYKKEKEKEIMKKYQTILDVYQTQKAIEKLRHYFQDEFADTLSLTRVTAPLFVLSGTGLNDELNGIEKAVSFQVFDHTAEIVHSLAKWKRYALKKYDFYMHKGIYTDMNAIRKDETADAIHSYYVDQWDWEYIIEKEERTIKTLKEIVKKIYKVLLKTEDYITKEFPSLYKTLPEDIYFITSQELEDLYPHKSPKEREYEICKDKKAVFLMQIGKELKSGISHDGRSPDYDDWELNGDILVWYDVLGIPFELSSMGIRVDKDSLIKQIEIRDASEKLEQSYHQMILKEELPYTIGGGIGQSRVCMFLLEKAHIGEVQVSVWPEDLIKEYEEKGIKFL